MAPPASLREALRAGLASEALSLCVRLSGFVVRGSIRGFAAARSGYRLSFIVYARSALPVPWVLSSRLEAAPPQEGGIPFPPTSRFVVRGSIRGFAAACSGYRLSFIVYARSALPVAWVLSSRLEAAPPQEGGIPFPPTSRFFVRGSLRGFAAARSGYRLSFIVYARSARALGSVVPPLGGRDENEDSETMRL